MMKNALAIPLVSLLLTLATLAETRTFTNTAGKSLTAELIAVEKEEAVLKLANASKVKVPLKSLSEDDQTYIKSWWEENKNNVTEMDVRLEISKNSERVSKSGGGDAKGKGPKKKVSTDEVKYDCVLKSYTRRDLSDIAVTFTTYKRVSTRGEEGSSITTEEISGSTTIGSLPSHESATFETDTVTCEDSSEKGGKGPSKSKRESVIGVVITLSANGKEFLTQSHPDNFLDRLKQEEEKEADKED